MGFFSNKKKIHMKANLGRVSEEGRVLEWPTDLFHIIATKTPTQLFAMTIRDSVATVFQKHSTRNSVTENGHLPL